MWRVDISKMAVAVLIVAVCASPVRPASYKYEETDERRIELGEVEQLLIANKSGDVTVIGEDGRTEILLTVTKYVRTEDEARAKKIAGEMDIKIERSGKELSISALFPKDLEGKKSIISVLLQRDPRARMDFVILAPKNVSVKVKASSGDIAVEDVAKNVLVASASGDVDVARIGGEVEIGVSSGDISVRDIAGSANLSTSSGNVEGDMIRGNVVVKTSSGDIEIEKIEGDITITTASGDTRVRGVTSVDYKGANGDATMYDVRGSVDAAAASGDLFFDIAPKGDYSYVLRTSSGDIELRFTVRMPGGYLLKAMTTNGDIAVDLPIKISKVGRHLISGVVRDGESVVALETVSGDISVAESEE